MKVDVIVRDAELIGGVVEVWMWKYRCVRWRVWSKVVYGGVWWRMVEGADKVQGRVEDGGAGWSRVEQGGEGWMRVDEGG